MARFKLKYKYFMGGLQITFKVWSNGEIDRWKKVILSE